MNAPDETGLVFGRVLRNYREEAALTQEELAKRAGLTSRAISDMERGRTAKPYVKSVRLLADALGLPASARARLLDAARDRTTMAGQIDQVGSEGHPGITGWPGIAVPRQLPVAVPSFVGRDAELKALSSLLGEPGSTHEATRVAVVSGTAGVGKTSLAMNWAHQAVADFPDGQLYANLRGFGPSGQPAKPDDVIRAFLEALQVPADRVPHAAAGREGLYRSLLADKRMLVVLDNARDADQVRPLLPGGGKCLTVITSRDQMTGLVAAEGALQVCLGVLSYGDAQSLLTLRLRDSRVAHEPEAAAKLLELCAQLPLALAIVGARAAARPEFPLSVLAAELQQVERSLDILDGGDATTDLRAVFSWSYQELSTGAARMFRLAGLHHGPDVTVPAAASLAGVGKLQARRLLGELSRVHLLAEHAPGRYSCHDLLRAYAVEQAAQCESDSERRDAVQRLLGHYLHTAAAADHLLYKCRRPIVLAPMHTGVIIEHLTSHEQALAWFDSERRCLIAAITLAVHSELDVYAWQVPWAMETYLYTRSHWHDWSDTQYAAMNAARRLGSDEALTEAHSGIASAQLELGRPADALRRLAQALRLCEKNGDLACQGRIHLEIARAKEKQGRFSEALVSSQLGLRLSQAADSNAATMQEGAAYNQIGWELNNLGRYHEALGYCQRALALSRRLGDKASEPFNLDSLAYSLRHLGRHAEAADCYRRAVELHDEFGNRYTQAETLISAGEAHHEGGDIRAARSAWTQALAILEELCHPDASQILARLHS